MTIRIRFILSVLGVALLAAAPARLAAQTPNAAKIAEDRKRADNLFLDGKTEEAKTIYLGMAASLATDFDFNKRLGYCLFVSPKKELSDAAVYYGRAHQLNQNDPEVELNLGKALSWSGQFKAAVPVFQRIVARDPGNPDPWLELARAQNYGGEVAAARQTYQYYVSHWYNDREVRLEFADFLASKKLFDASLEQYRSVQRIDRSNFRARQGEADVLSWQGKLQEGLAAYNNILRTAPDRYEALRGKGFALLWLQRYEEAARAFADANRQRPPDRDIQDAMGQIARWRTEEPLRRAQDELNALSRQAEEAMARNDYPRAIDFLRQAIAHAPQDGALRMRLGQAYSWSSQWDPAIETFQRLYSDQPDNQDALRELGNAQMNANRLPDATASFRAYLQRSPDPAIQLSLARVLSWSGKFEEAIAAYEQLLRSEPDNFDASLGLAQTLSWNGQLVRAQEIFDSLLRQRPGNRDALLGKAQTFYWSGDIDHSLEMLESMRRTFPEDREIAGVLQSVRDAERQRAAQPAAAPAGPAPTADTEELIRTYQQRLAQNPQDVIAAETLGNLFLQKNDYKPAISSYELALKLKPDDTSLRVKLAQVASWDRDFPRSISLYQGLVAQEPDKVEYRAELAKVLSWAGRNQESIEQYREVLKRNPGDLESRLALARVLSWNKQYDESLEEYAQVLTSQPANRDATVERARVLSWKGQWEAAVNLYDSVLVRAPENRDARLGKAQTLYWSGRAQQAKGILEELQTKYPEDRDVALTSAGVQAALGRTSLALRQLDELDKLQPGNAEVQSMSRRIRQDLRPVLILGVTPSVDNQDLAMYSSTATLYFSPSPRVRSYLFAGITPSNDPTGSQTGREVLFGTYGRVNDRLMLRGEVGGNTATSGRQGAIGGASATFFVTDNLQFSVEGSRRYLNYIPKPVLLGINRDEFRTNWDWRPSARTAFHGDYYHQRYSDTNHNNGGDLSVVEQLVRKERFTLESGYLYAVYGFTRNISSGFFAPSQLQRHAMLLNISGKLSPKVSYYFWGSLGGEQIAQDPFRVDGTGRVGLDLALSEHFKLGMGYGYFALSSIATAGAYRTNTGYATFEIRF